MAWNENVSSILCSRVGFGLACACRGFVMAITTAVIYVYIYISHCVQKIMVSYSHLLLLALTLFKPPLLQPSLSFDKGNMIYLIPFMSKHSAVSYSLWFYPTKY